MPMVAVEGGSIACQCDGSGEPVVFVSGLGGMGAFWGAQVRAFSDRHAVVTFDHRGVGGSAGTPPYSVAQWAGDLLTIADHLHLERFHLVGHSTGGIISQYFAATHPDRVRTLALGGTWLSPDRRFRTLFELRKDVLTTLGEEAYRAFGDLLASSAEWEQGASARPPETPRDVVLARIDALLAYRGEDHAARIVAPVLVLSAADDHLLPAYQSDPLAKAIAGARTMRFDGGGHFFPRTRAAAYNNALSHFWAEASGQ